MNSTWTPLPSPPAQLGESPFWHAQEQRLYWVDIAGRALWRWHAASGAVDRWAMPSEPGCIAPAQQNGVDNGWVVALRDRIVHAPQWGGALHDVARLPIDPATQRANDGKCDALGRFWVGTVHEPASGPRQNVAALYCVDLRDASAVTVRPLLEGVATANGLAWSPDGRTLYWADTPAHVVRAWDCNAAHEPVGAPRVFQRFAPKPDGWQWADTPATRQAYGGRPDGAVVDAEGAYWCAMYEGGAVLRFAADGALLGAWPLPLACPTMPCLADGQLWVTTARKGRPEAELAQTPQAGQVLALGLAVDALPVAVCRIG